jgi:predicted nucleic-acid-binding protein
MIGLDTNVIVRYLAQDDPKQSGAATRLIESLSAEKPGLVTSVVLAKTTWVMDESYSATREEIAEIVQRLLQTGALMVQDAEQAWQALARYRTGTADFADYLIERTCAALGSEATYTFNRKAARKNDCAMTLVS